uniref:Uncharacterized protein n=1 Tax=uncultured marine virus TaxID=186617 RepID=A0A0F7L0D6_9VIRU|nr:hypothetical protein [uncultured marine virus]
MRHFSTVRLAALTSRTAERPTARASVISAMMSMASFVGCMSGNSIPPPASPWSSARFCSAVVMLL